MSGKPKEPAPAPEAAAHQPLIFDWSRNTTSWRSTLFWMLQIAALLLAFSAVFRLHHTTQAQRLSRGHSILLLDSGTDAVEPVLDRAADMSFLALGSGLDEDMEAEIAKGLPKFHPSFQDATVSIKARPEDSPKQRDFPQIIAAAGVMPPVQRPKQASTSSQATSPKLHWQADSELAQRAEQQPKPLPPALAAVAGGISFHIAVDAAGRVRFALPLEPVSLAPADLAALRQTVAELRFLPAQEAALCWDTVNLKPLPAP